MRTVIFYLVFAISLASACAPNAGPLDITKIYSGTVCETAKDNDGFNPYGSLDTYGSAYYQLRFQLRTNLTGGGTADDLVVGGTILDKKGREGIVINALKVSYTSDPPVPGFKDFTFPMALMPDPNVNEKYYTPPIPIMGPETAKALMDLPVDHEPVTLYAKIVFQGYTQRGGVKITSGPAIYPITVTKTTVPGCSKVRVFNACSNLGQDGQAFGIDRCCDGKCADGGTTTGGLCPPPAGCL